ncbi:Nif3-like dinuclear metal center hexameric protein [Lacticaseibacillus sp. GG6-2]
MPKGKELIERFEQFAPKALAVPGDPIGIQLGDPTREVKRVLVTLDVRPEVVQEAIAMHADMIFAHHPAMFRPVANLDLRDPQKLMYATCLRHDLLVYAAHTNLDRVAGGMNDWLAAALALKHVRPFIEAGDEAGMGRVGELPAAMPLADFVAIVKQAFQVPGLRVVANDLTRPIKTVAVLGGDGGKFYLDAQAAGADVYITGDVYYHTGHDMLAHDMPVIDPGHHIESIMKANVQALLQDWADEAGWQLQVSASQLNTDPYRFM